MKDTDAMPDVAFLRHYMDALGFKEGEGYDWKRGAQFFGIKHELFFSMARGDSPILKRERQKIAKRAMIAIGLRKQVKKDIDSVERRKYARMGKYLRKMRERLMQHNGTDRANSQLQLGALMDVSTGAIQAWEYGASRIPGARLTQYLQIVGATAQEATKAWVMLGEMPQEIQEAVACEEPVASRMLIDLMEYCQIWTLKTEEEKKMAEHDSAVEEQQPVFATSKEHIAYLVEQGMPLAEAHRILAEERKPRGAEARVADKFDSAPSDEI